MARFTAAFCAAVIAASSTAAFAACFVPAEMIATPMPVDASGKVVANAPGTAKERKNQAGLARSRTAAASSVLPTESKKRAKISMPSLISGWRVVANL